MGIMIGFTFQPTTILMAVKSGEPMEQWLNSGWMLYLVQTLPTLQTFEYLMVIFGSLHFHMKKAENFIEAIQSFMKTQVRLLLMLLSSDGAIILPIVAPNTFCTLSNPILAGNLCGLIEPPAAVLVVMTAVVMAIMLMLILWLAATVLLLFGLSSVLSELELSELPAL